MIYISKSGFTDVSLLLSPEAIILGGLLEGSSWIVSTGSGSWGWPHKLISRINLNNLDDLEAKIQKHPLISQKKSLFFLEK